MVHQFKNNGYDIVLDVNSGAIHVVDDVTYDVIALFEDHSREEIIAQLQSRYPEQEIAEAIEETEQLKEQGDLFTEDAYEQKIFDFKKRPTVVKALCLHKEMDNVVLSIDGRKEVNDRMRPFRKGAGSYDLIVPKFQKLAESRNQERYYVRGTYTHFNTDFSKDVLHLADLGFKQISVEPVVAQPTDEYALQEEDLPVLFEEYDKLAAEMVRRNREGNSFNFFHFMIDLEGGPCVYKRLSGCGSGTEYLAVTPWGDLYPCHQFVGNEDFLMGNVWDGVKNTNLQDEFKCCNVYAKEKCRKCFARFYCSGGCAANSYNFHGTITDAYDLGCELQKKRIECAIMIKAAEAEN